MKQLPRQGNDRPLNEKCIWVHALSVGETLSAVAMVKKLAADNPSRGLIFTVSTKTGHDIAQKQIKPFVDAVRYFPYDFFFSVTRAIDVINPRHVIMVETDLWPNFLFELKRRNIPVFLVNARLSKRSFDGYRRLAGFMGAMLNIFSSIYTQSDKDTLRFKHLGGIKERIHTMGNFKFDQERVIVSENEITAFKKKMGITKDRKIIVAGSTHEGEEEVLCGALTRLVKTWPALSLVLVPRDPVRADGICRMFSNAGFLTLKMSDAEKSAAYSSITDVLVVDTIGMLRKLYAVADIAFVGGSLVKKGGQNPLEAACQAKPVLFGPHMDDFEEISHFLVKDGGAMVVHDLSEIVSAIEVLFANTARAILMGENAMLIHNAHTGAVEKTLDAISKTLPQSCERV